MNIEERAAQAAAWKATGQCNCAQAVMKAFEDKLPVDNLLSFAFSLSFRKEISLYVSLCYLYAI